MFDSEAIEFDDIFEEYYEYGQQIKQYVTDTSVILNDALDAGKRVLFEGAQGVMLDIDQGTYPFVTSSNPVAGGVTIGSGVGPSKLIKWLVSAKRTLHVSVTAHSQQNYLMKQEKPFVVSVKNTEQQQDVRVVSVGLIQ